MSSIDFLQFPPALPKWSVLATVLVCALVALIARSARPPALRANVPKLISDHIPFVGAIRFWTARREFFEVHGAQSATGAFSYFIGKHHVVGLTGDTARKAFFESKDLDSTEGYGVLFGQSPNTVRNAGEERVLEEGFLQFFARRLANLLGTENLARSLPNVISDTKIRLDELAAVKNGVTDPFKSIYDIVFQLTMRMVGCTEMTNDRKLLDKVLKLYETVEKSATATTIVFPGMPTPAFIKRMFAGGRLYMIISGIIADRKKTGRREEDPLQHLIDLGDDTEKVINFILGALFAGQLNSGINAAYLLVYLASDPIWFQKVRDEIEAVAAKYCHDEGASLAEKLTQIPVAAWESEFPVADMCLRESIRIQLVGAAFRKNIGGKDVKVGDEIIPNGSFATYHLADVHKDPEIYPEPDKWDPSRFLPGRFDNVKKPYPYIGWGVARHPCLGMRFAKLEQNVITSFFIAYFDFYICDANGTRTDKLPVVRENSYNPSKPDPSVYLKLINRI